MSGKEKTEDQGVWIEGVFYTESEFLQFAKGHTVEDMMNNLLMKADSKKDRRFIIDWMADHY